MWNKLKKTLLPALAIGIIIYWYTQHFREQEISMYSLKCLHNEYNEVIRWHLLKRKRKEEVPSSLYDGPWLSEKFSLTSNENHLVKIGTLKLATAELFKFTSLKNSGREIYINRRNLRFKPENHLGYTYTCEIRNPGEFWKYVNQKLKIEKAQLKI